MRRRVRDIVSIPGPKNNAEGSSALNGHNNFVINKIGIYVRSLSVIGHVDPAHKLSNFGKGIPAPGQNRAKTFLFLCNSPHPES
jgi:hypothetical protein